MGMLPLTRSISTFAIISIAFSAAIPQTAVADEGGVSFWLPGQFGSLAAVPQQPGWSFADVYYHTSVNAGGDVAAARELELGAFTRSATVSLNAALNARQPFLVVQQQQAFEENPLQPLAQRNGLLPHGEAKAIGRRGQDCASIKCLDLAAEPVLHNPIAQTFQILAARGIGIAALADEFEDSAVVAMQFA